MSIDNPLSPPMPLRDVLSRIGQHSSIGWTLIPLGVERVTLDTPCLLQTFDSGDVSPEDMEAFEASLQGLGVQFFLEAATLADIRDNLRDQRINFTNGDLESAITYYWLNDAFIELPSLPT